VGNRLRVSITEATHPLSSRDDDRDRDQSDARLIGAVFGAFGCLRALQFGEVGNLVGNCSPDEAVVRLKGLALVVVQEISVSPVGWGLDSSRRGLPTGAKV
jgi:hypothetical protein